MPAFSFTAPHITPEQEREEKECLGDEMRRHIQAEMYGVDSPVDHDQPSVALAMSEESLDGLEKVMEKFPLRQKKEYLEALALAPHLVQTESEPSRFLHCEKGNVEAAATRLVHYWKIRRKLFGEHRAYLPMSMTGAMAQDKDLFESGFIAIHHNDDHGRTVLFIDRVRAIPSFATRDATLRCLFFMIHVLIFDEWPSSNSKGCVCIVNIKGYDLYKHFDRLMSKHISILLLHSMPMKIKALHLLTGSAEGVMSLVLPSMKQVMGRECRLRMQVHAGNNDKMMESLRPYGLNRRNLSETLGGDFKYDDFLEWLERWKGNHRKDFSISSTQPEDFSDSEFEQCELSKRQNILEAPSTSIHIMES